MAESTGPLQRTRVPERSEIPASQQTRSRRSSARALRSDEACEGVPEDAVMSAPELIRLDCEKYGWLQKRGEQSSFRRWKKRFVVIRGAFLYYFASDKSSAPKGIVALDGAGLQMEASKFQKRPPCFVITSSMYRRFYFHGSDPDDSFAWFETIRSCSPVVVGEPIELLDNPFDDDSPTYIGLSQHSDEDETNLDDNDQYARPGPPPQKPDDMSEEDFAAVLAALQAPDDAAVLIAPNMPLLVHEHDDYDAQEEENEASDTDSVHDLDVDKLLSDPSVANAIASLPEAAQIAWLMTSEQARESAALRRKMYLLEEQIEELAGQLDFRAEPDQGEMESKNQTNDLNTTEKHNVETERELRQKAELRANQAESEIQDLKQQLQYLKTNNTTSKASPEKIDESASSNTNQMAQENTDATVENLSNDTVIASLRRDLSHLRGVHTKRGIEVQSLKRDLEICQRENNVLRREILRLHARYKSQTVQQEPSETNP